MTLFIVILYIIIGFIIGCGIYVFLDDSDCDIAGVFGGMLWPLTILIMIVYHISKFLCTHICNVLEYIKKEGIHYCKEEIPPCCGKCKYMYYHNNHNELNGCRLYNGHSHLSSSNIHCEEFKKHWLWRFRIRHKWDDKS